MDCAHSPADSAVDETLSNARFLPYGRRRGTKRYLSTFTGIAPADTSTATPPGSHGSSGMRAERNRSIEHERFQGYEASAWAQPQRRQQRWKATAQHQPRLRFQWARRGEGARRRPNRL